MENEKPKEKNILSSKKNINNNNNICGVAKINTQQNEKILKLNEQNLEDLDALYFYDKVKMKNNKKKSVSIPKIFIKPQELQDDDEEEEEEYEEDERSKTLKRSLTNGEFIGINDIKFKSPFYIKVKQAFI